MRRQEEPLAGRNRCQRTCLRPSESCAHADRLVGLCGCACLAAVRSQAAHVPRCVARWQPKPWAHSSICWAAGHGPACKLSGMQHTASFSLRAGGRTKPS